MKRREGPKGRDAGDRPKAKQRQRDGKKPQADDKYNGHPLDKWHARKTGSPLNSHGLTYAVAFFHSEIHVSISSAMRSLLI